MSDRDFGIAIMEERMMMWRRCPSTRLKRDRRRIRRVRGRSVAVFVAHASDSTSVDPLRNVPSTPRSAGLARPQRAGLTH